MTDPTHLASDHRVESDNRSAALIPEADRCKRCEGTGNELMFMYRRCAACWGSGKSQGNEGDFND